MEVQQATSSIGQLWEVRGSLEGKHVKDIGEPTNSIRSDIAGFVLLTYERESPCDIQGYTSQAAAGSSEKQNPKRRTIF